MDSIFVNQIGYKSKCPKYAYVSLDRLSFIPENFEILNENKETVCSGKLSSPKKDRLANENVCIADFSSLEKEGQYTVLIKSKEPAEASEMKTEESFKFTVTENAYDDVYEKMVHFFYLSRCGQEIKSKTDDGKWNHPACHTQIAEVYGNTEVKKQIVGGWHDAGDYGRYVIATSKAAMDLMMTYEAIGDENRKTVLLDEVRYGLDWMLQMQREDGAVYHKVTGYHFCGFVMPQCETETQVLAPVSTGATADFAGCLAYASLLFRNIDDDYSDTLLQAAIKAQSYLDCHEDELYQNPPEITTGGYGDKNVSDERFFALAALYIATGLSVYLTKALEIREKSEDWFVGYGWGSVAGYGTEILLRKGTMMDKSTYDLLLADVLKRADNCLETSNQASYGTCFNKVVWGSNGNICDEAHMLILAFDLTGKNEYVAAAQKQLDYVFGCNPMNICYVTRFGTQWPKNPHHRPSGSMKISMPGMVAGGPSEWLADAVAKKELEGKAPLCCYIDHVGSYCTNEIDIYWNSPLIYLTARML